MIEKNLFLFLTEINALGIHSCSLKRGRISLNMKNKIFKNSHNVELIWSFRFTPSWAGGGHYKQLSWRLMMDSFFTFVMTLSRLSLCCVHLYGNFCYHRLVVWARNAECCILYIYCICIYIYIHTFTQRTVCLSLRSEGGWRVPALWPRCQSHPIGGCSDDITLFCPSGEWWAGSVGC